MKIVFLERKTLGDDIDLSAFEQYGEVVYYDASVDDQVAERVHDADVVIANKVHLNETTLGRAKNVKLICLTATGSDNLDKPWLEKAGIEWHNAAGYSTEDVAQHTFALYFYLAEKLRTFDDFVKSGGYAASRRFTWYGRIIEELHGKTWGIVGLGAIGRRVAQVAEAFGARVIWYSTSGTAREEQYERVDDFAEFLGRCDVVSVHAPADERTIGMMNAEAFSLMKNTAYFINVARGAIVNEPDLAAAIESGEIAGAGLDVLCEEPMNPANPLFNIKDSEKLIITPHIAWAPLEARTRLMNIVEGHVRDYVNRRQSS
ncbi:MAG: hydroxyacid dehydrogenase [Eubacterium sp.]|nr:hydroxyacid dehydrogenase [Eubacterium sp.]